MLNDIIARLQSAGELALAEQLATALLYEDERSAYDAMMRHPRAFIHFTNGVPRSKDSTDLVPRMGINPSNKSHHDPHGVYFYPIAWLLRHAREHRLDSLYGTTMQFYYVADIQLGAGGVNLYTMTAAQADKIARSNGWLAELQKVRGDTRLLPDSLPDAVKRRPGALLYGCADYLVNVEKSHRWTQLLRGVDYLYDPGYGIINQNEPAQVCVINPKLITVLESGENKEKTSQIVSDVMKAVAAQLGGDISYSNRQPQLSTKIDGRPITVRPDFGNYRCWVTSYRAGVELTAPVKIDGTTLDAGTDAIVQHIVYVLKQIARDSTPTGTPPTFTLKDAQDIVDAVWSAPAVYVQHMSARSAPDKSGRLWYSTQHGDRWMVRFEYDHKKQRVEVYAAFVPDIAGDNKIEIKFTTTVNTARIKKLLMQRIQSAFSALDFSVLVNDRGVPDEEWWREKGWRSLGVKAEMP